jgi:hypothetical protein
MRFSNQACGIQQSGMRHAAFSNQAGSLRQDVCQTRCIDGLSLMMAGRSQHDSLQDAWGKGANRSRVEPVAQPSGSLYHNHKQHACSSVKYPYLSIKVSSEAALLEPPWLQPEHRGKHIMQHRTATPPQNLQPL